MATDHSAMSSIEIHLIATGPPRRGLYRFFPPATRAELWAGLAFVVFSLLGAAGVIKSRLAALALEQDSATMEGRVLRLWTTQAKRGWRYHVEYEYAASAEASPLFFRNETELPPERFGSLREGGPIAVTVCRADPANHQVVGEHPRVFSSAAATFVCLGFLALLALGGFINLWWWWFSCRQPIAAQVLVLGMKNVQS